MMPPPRTPAVHSKGQRIFWTLFFFPDVPYIKTGKRRGRSIFLLYDLSSCSRAANMDNAYVQSTSAVLKHFDVQEASGLSNSAVTESRQKHGRNGMWNVLAVFLVHDRLTLSPALPEEPPTPIWELILEQFKDQLVLILLASAAVSFVLALFEDSNDWTVFVDPIVVR
jgi:magnesium-transporting ATPase (P-type)